MVYKNIRENIAGGFYLGNFMRFKKKLGSILFIINQILYLVK